MNLFLRQLKLFLILGIAALSFQACSGTASTYFAFHSKYFFACTDSTNSNFISFHVSMEVLLKRSGDYGNVIPIGSNVTVDNLLSYKTNNPLISEDNLNYGTDYLGNYPAISLYVSSATLVYSNGGSIITNNSSIILSASSNHVFNVSEGYNEYRIIMDVDKSLSNAGSNYIFDPELDVY